MFGSTPRYLAALMASASMLGAASIASAANLLLEYDAASGNTPTGVSPAWSYSGPGSNPEMTLSGGVLIQDDAGGAQQAGEYLSPTLAAGTFTRGGADYGIEFTVRPLTDLRFIGGDWGEVYLTWSDDQFNYNISIDLYGGAATSGTGDIVYGRNSFSPAITGIDWSTAHTIFIGHRGSGTSSVFDFYLDGAIISTITDGSIARTGSYAQDAIGFGDGTTGGEDVNNEWHSIRVWDVNDPSLVPEPGSFALIGLGSLCALLRSKRR